MKKQRRRHEFYLFLVVILLIVLFTINSNDFLTLSNLLDLLNSYSFLAIMSAGMLLVLISGGIDLSFTAMVTIAEYAIAYIIIDRGANLFTALLIAILIGTLLGSFNALIIYFFKAPALIVTIATLNIFYGFIILITKGRWIYNFPEWFKKIRYIIQFGSIEGNQYGITLPLLLLFLVLVLTYFILNFTMLGRKIFAVGGNQEAARRMGFNLFLITLFVYSFMGFLAGIGAITHVLIVQTVQANAVVGRELEVIAAVVLGGASLTGGKGTILGTILGVTLIAIIWNGMVLMGISSYWHQVIIGMIILISVISTAKSSKKDILGDTQIDVE